MTSDKTRTAEVIGGRLSLGGLILLSLAGYGLLALVFPLLAHYDDAPPPDVRTFTPSLAAGLAYAALFGVLYGLYWLAYRQVVGGRWQGAGILQNPKSKIRQVASILMVTAVFSLPLLFTFPFNSTDLYRYFIRGRITSVYHQSPYQVAAVTLADDPYAPLAGEWADETSPYGPLWEMTAAGVTMLAGQNLLLALLTFKGLGLIGHLALSALIWLHLKGQDPAVRAGRTLLWAWNPALLLTFVANGHNDWLMLVWLLGGAWLMRQEGWRPVVGFALMSLGALSKLIGLLALPFFFLATWRRLTPGRDRLRFLLVAPAASLLLSGLVFLPFGSPLDLLVRLVREASAGGGYSPAALVVLLGRGLGLSLPLTPFLNTLTLLFVVLALWQLVEVWRGRRPARATANVFTAYLAQAFSFRIWYAAWPLPWLLLEDDQVKGWQGDKETAENPHPLTLSPPDRAVPSRLLAGLLFLLTSQLSVVIYGHLWRLALGGDHLWSHLLGVPFTFGLPLFLAWRGRPTPR